MTTGSLTAAAAAPDVGSDPVQPLCGLCGVTDINFVRAAAAGWRLVLGRLGCTHCASRFPVWMLRQF